MFFSKFIVPAVALFGAATSVFASPVAQPAAELITKRGDANDVYNACQHVHDTCEPLIVELAAAVDVVAAIDVIADVFADVQVELLGLVGVDVTANIDAIVAVNVDLIVKLIVAISARGLLDLSIYAQVDAFISAYLDVLAKINADICVKIGAGIPLIYINLFVNLKLILTAHVLVLVDIFALL